MSLTDDHLRRIARTAHAADLGFVELVGLAELNPATAFQGAVLRGNLRNQNLTGFDFTGAQFLEGCDLTGADLSEATGVTHQTLARAIWDETTILPRALFWATGQPPSWAEDWGLDTYGPWVTFRIPNTSVTQRMRWCPPGAFMMGSPRNEPASFDNEGPLHRVTFEQGFWMCDTPCTEALWSVVVSGLFGRRRGANYPVIDVNWDQAQEFVRRLNALIPGLSVDLTSEARWEYACRAGTVTPYCFGKSVTEEQARFHSKGPVPAGSLPPNPWGLHEMHGNIWEWCSDYWHTDYIGAPTDGSAWLDLEGAAYYRVIRGGSWDDHAGSLRSAFRDRSTATRRNSKIGFRCASVSPTNEAALTVAPADSGSRPSTERAQSQRSAPTAITHRVGKMLATTPPKPAWATASGRDQYGRFSNIEVPGTAITQRLRWCPPGAFTMGSPKREPGHFSAESPRHKITLTQGFWLFETPCTQAMWEAVMGGNPSRFKTPTRPVEQVSFANATTFINKLNALIPGLRLSLPSEAQWEYACRAGAQTATYAGAMVIAGENNAPVLDAIAWYGGNSGQGFELFNGADSSSWQEKQYQHTKAGTHPVGAKTGNKWGLHDMLGNVWEWCADHWHDDYVGAPTDGSAWLDTDITALRVVRGGSWHGVARNVRSAYRRSLDPANRDINLGFRCAQVQSDSEAGPPVGRGKPRERSDWAATTGRRGLPRI